MDLAVVQGVVRQSGGHLTVDSRPGVGTTFHIHLPALPNVAAHQAETKISEPPRGRETILLVEDEEDVRRVTTLLLERYGYTVLAGANGRQAQEIFRAHAPDISLVLTGLVIPEMSGYELAAALRAQQPWLKVIFMSGYTDGGAIRRAKCGRCWISTGLNRIPAVERCSAVCGGTLAGKNSKHQSPSTREAPSSNHPAGCQAVSPRTKLKVV